MPSIINRLLPEPGDDAGGSDLPLDENGNPVDPPIEVKAAAPTVAADPETDMTGSTSI